MDFLDKLAQNSSATTSFLQKNLPWVEQPLFFFGNSSITIRSLVQFVLIVVFFYLLASVLRRSLRKISEKQNKLPQKIANSLSRFIFYFVFILGLLLAMVSIGLNFTSIAVVAGLFSVALGFGLQSVVQNLVAGFILLWEKHIRLDHIIQLESGVTGKVIAMRLRTTVLKTFANTAVLVPNFELLSKRVVNLSLLKEKRRLQLAFTVAFGTDKEKLASVLIEKANKIPYTISDISPELWMTRIGDNGLEFELIVSVDLAKEPFLAKITSDYLNMIDNTLRENNIEIPYPVRDVRLKK